MTKEKKIIGVELDKDLVKRLLDHKAKTGCPMSEAVRRGLNMYLDANDEAKK